MSETTALAPAREAALPQAGGLDVLTLGRVLAKSGYFRDAREEAQAVVKILFGMELGLGAVAAMTGIYIVDGKPTLSANVIASLIRRSRRYDYRVIERSDQRCELGFLERSASGQWQELGRSAWTMQDAVRAGLASKDNWKHYPRAMLFGRALSEGARAYCPDLFAGAGAYVPEELGAEVQGESGEPLPPPEPEHDLAYWRRRAMALYTELGGDTADRDACRADLARMLGIEPTSRTELTLEQWRTCAEQMEKQRRAAEEQLPMELEEATAPAQLQGA